MLECSARFSNKSFPECSQSNDLNVECAWRNGAFAHEGEWSKASVVAETASAFLSLHQMHIWSNCYQGTASLELIIVFLFVFFGKRLAVGIETNLLDPQKYSKLHFSLLWPCLYLFSSHSFTLTLSQHKSKWALLLVWIRSQMSVCVCVCRLSFTHAAAACMDRWFVLALSLPDNRIPVLNQKLRRINQCLCQCKRNIRDDVKFRFTTQLAHITKSNQM